MNETQRIEKQIAELQRTIDFRKGELAKMHKDCSHKWGAVTYDPIVTQPYTIPGDPPGTMGVDWRGPCYVEGTTTKQWKRTCAVCGLTQTTQRTKKNTVCGLSSEVPDFGS